jgi:tRNA threonylcarbamoyladenosine biosynthesis protein TsaE
VSSHIDLVDEAATEALGAALASAIEEGAVLHLRGDLGAGKTTLSRGLLRALGHAGAVKSPTYTLVEPYAPGGRQVFHFDLYRLRDPAELEDIGIRDYLQPAAILLIEWPEQGGPCTPPADLLLELRAPGAGREARWSAVTPRGEVIVARLEKTLGRA